MAYKILLAGDGGQGIQLLADVICQSAFHIGHEVAHIPNYGLEQRGGVSLAFIQIDSEKISYPKFNRSDLLLLLSAQANERTKEYQKEAQELLRIDDYKETLNNLGIKSTSYNIFFLGIILKKLLEKKLVDLNRAEEILLSRLGDKPNWSENEKAFNAGMNLS